MSQAYEKKCFTSGSLLWTPRLQFSMSILRSRSHRSSRRHHSRSRSRSHSHRRHSRSRSRSWEYRRRRSHSRSPMSNRRRHIGNRVSNVRHFFQYKIQKNFVFLQLSVHWAGFVAMTCNLLTCFFTILLCLLSQANPDPNSCLGVFGLSLYTTERDLREVFSKYGPLSDVNIVYDQQSRRSRGFAFVYFENSADSKEVRKMRQIMHFKMLQCCQLPPITKQNIFITSI